MIDMNEKAANDGDKIKHSLLLSVLEQCNVWPEITYAETHSGAGKYKVEDQLVSTHIKDFQFELSDEHSQIHGYESEYDDAYSIFMKHNWWSLSKNKDIYPGSPLLAGRYMLQRENVELRLVEADETIFNKLGKSFSPIFNFEIVLDKFQNQIQWITEKDWSVILIDPFVYKSENEECNLDVGDINLKSVSDILQKLWDKKASVVLFWCYFPEGESQAKQAIGSLAKIVSDNSGLMKTFVKRHYYVMAIGIGDGKRVVSNLPTVSRYYQSLLGN